MKPATTGFALVPADGGEPSGEELWLRATPDAGLPRGRIVEMRYAAGLSGRDARPILRFVSVDGRTRDVLMPAPLEGVGVWRGRIPIDAAQVRISPPGRARPGSFVLLSVRRIPLSTLMRFVTLSPKRAFFVAGATLARLRDEADLNLAWLFGQAETQDVASWRSARKGAAEPVTEPAPPVAIVVHAREAAREDLAATLASLRDQTYDAWRLVLVDPPAAFADRAGALGDPRVIARQSLQRADLPADGFVGFLQAGDTIAPEGLASFAARFAAEPACDLVYADEFRATGQGIQPVFKPDWSPVRQQFSPYVGRAALVRTAMIPDDPGIEDGPDAAIATLLTRAEAGKIGHLRGAVVTTRDDPRSTAARLAAPGPGLVSDAPRVGIVVPTRDRLDLLRPCIESVLRLTDRPDFRIVIADNGSAEPATLRWLEEIERDPRVAVAAMPGPFNFAGICNRAARLLDCELLLFLNNDTEVLDPSWLLALADFALRPDVGAVGAKLLHADGRVQHAGVVLGLGGVAGHFGAGLPADAPGWLGGNLAPHEVSAVTGACMMVESRKFWSVGGFDDVNLPVELNDIDLCLRLAERGWRTLCDCRTRLLHHESASRGGATFRLQRVYAAERRYFAARWRHIIRDDPFFNPALSLYARHPLLW